MTTVPRNPRALALPFDEWRTGQHEVLTEILESSAPVVMLRARTGFGKAAIAMGLSMLEPRGGLILTHTHQLQEQYGELGAAVVKGRSNFWCPKFDRKGQTGDKCGTRCIPGQCEYAEQKWEGEQSPATTTNYAYALRVLRNDTFAGRSWIVADEGQHFLGTMEDVFIEEEEEKAGIAQRKLEKQGMLAAAKQIEPAGPPLWPSQLFPERLRNRADRILVMSATLPPKNVWSFMHGVPHQDILHIDAPDTWPNNSPLYVWPVVTLNKDSNAPEFDRLAEAIQDILNRNPDKKGLIHAHSYNIMREMYDRIRDPRIVWGLNDRKQAIRHFVATPNPAVLFATSVHEGFDLPYELGFQIIPKVPFPSLGDPKVRDRAKQFKAWYAMETVNAIQQAWGRVVRAPDDEGATYILDASVKRLIREYPDLWAPWVKRQTYNWVE